MIHINLNIGSVGGCYISHTPRPCTDPGKVVKEDIGMSIIDARERGLLKDDEPNEDQDISEE